MLNAFTGVFLTALGAALAVRLWLAARQVRHVRAHRAAVPPAFADTIPLASHQTAADYTVAKSRLGMVDVLLDAAVLLVLTLGGLLQRVIEEWSRLLPEESLWHGVAVILTVLLARGLLQVPLSAWRTFVIEARFGFNRMTPGLFIADLVKQALVGAALGVPVLLAVLWLMREAGELWWFYAWLLLAAYSLFLQMIYPAVVLPLFNKFSPLEDPALAERVRKLLERCGFRAKGLFVMDGSKRSAHGNAFFTGFGAGKRIVFFDTLLARLAPDEIEAVLAHELGHYRLHHIVKGMALSWAVSLALLAVLGLLESEAWFYQGLGVQSQSQGIALLLFLLVLPEFTFFLQPLMSRFSRKHEFEADRYATEHAAAGELVGALVKLYKDNASTLTPDPLHSAFYDSHPPAAIRIARLRTA
jgi:STE24 endopeptidase